MRTLYLFFTSIPDALTFLVLNAEIEVFNFLFSISASENSLSPLILNKVVADYSLSNPANELKSPSYTERLSINRFGNLAILCCDVAKGPMALRPPITRGLPFFRLYSIFFVRS